MPSSCEFILPTIDLSLLLCKYGGDSEHKQLEAQELKKLREACQGLGFFRVINHGIDPSLIQTMDSISRDMFALPVEIKERAIFQVLDTGNGQINLNPGYHRPGTGTPEGKYPLPEVMSFPSDPLVEEISSMLWPQEGNKKHCEKIHEYRSEMRELSQGILKLIICSLGLDVSKYYQSSPFDNCEGRLRMNLYHNTTAANEQILYKAHTDIGCLTILYQDDVGGLQIRTKEVEWINCEPLPGSFVVNIADCLQMWSNGRYHSAEHRVVHGGESKRLSMAFFWSFSDEAEIRAPEELIDHQNPQLYRPFKFKDLQAYRWQTAGPFLGQRTAHYEIDSSCDQNSV